MRLFPTEPAKKKAPLRFCEKDLRKWPGVAS
jgi:hypothetical protein